MKIKLTSNITADGLTLPKGTVLNFGTESFAVYRGRKIMKSEVPGLEQETVNAVNNDYSDGPITANDSGDIDASALQSPETTKNSTDNFAETVISILKAKYPEGFTLDQITEDCGSEINGAVYAVVDKDSTFLLKLDLENEQSIEIILKDIGDGVYVVTNDYDVTGMNVFHSGTEAFLGRFAMALLS